MSNSRNRRFVRLVKVEGTMPERELLVRSIFLRFLRLERVDGISADRVVVAKI